MSKLISFIRSTVSVSQINFTSQLKLTSQLNLTSQRQETFLFTSCILFYFFFFVIMMQRSIFDLGMVMPKFDKRMLSGGQPKQKKPEGFEWLTIH